MPSTFIKGEDMLLFVWISPAYLPIACLTSNSFNKAKTIIETTTKCDPSVVIRGSGTRSYELPFEGIYIDTTSATGDDTKASHDRLRALFNTDDLQTWRMDTGLADVPYYYGSGIFNQLDITSGSGDEFTSFTGNISGSGDETTTDPEA